MTERNPLNVFADRWKLDGDVIRCRSCMRGQQTSWMLHDFQHASRCKAVAPDRQPWLTLRGLIGAQLSRAKEPQP